MDELIKDLQDFLVEEEANNLNLDMEDEHFKIRSKEEANYFLKLLNQTNSEIEEINMMCNENIKQHTERVNRFREKEIATYSYRKSYLENILRTFAVQELEGKRTKTIKLPEGSLSLKKQKPKYLYDDELLLDFFKDKQEFLKQTVKVSVDKNKIKELSVQAGKVVYDGTIVEGIDVIDQEDSFTTKPTL